MPRPCPICDCLDVSPFHIVAGRETLICATCRHIFWAEVADERELVGFYATKYGWSHNQEALQAGNLAYYEGHVAELLAKYGRDDDDVGIVDVGCSYPCLLEVAQQRGYKNVLGVDWDQGARAYGLERGIRMLAPDEFLREAPAESVDILRFSHTIEHLIDPRQTLRQAVSKLKRGGLLYITQPSFPVFAVGTGGYELKDAVWPEHLHFFSPISLCQLVKSAGLKIATFFTHSNSDDMLTRHGPQLDLAYCAKALDECASLGEAFAGRTGNYPIYAGENSCLYARRLATANTGRRVTLARLRSQRGGWHAEPRLNAA